MSLAARLHIPMTLAAGLAVFGPILPATAATYKLLHAFGRGTDGAVPIAPLVDVNGVLYGVTDSGGVDNGSGVVFQVTPDGTETVLHRFTSDEGVGSHGGLSYFNGNLYGTNYLGGNPNVVCIYGLSGCGTVFELSTAGVYTDLYSFNGTTDGAKPEAGLTRLGDTFYGTTSGGGTENHGTVFKIAADGTLRTIANFGTKLNSGQLPVSDLVAVGHVLYGTTSAGGKLGTGTVFSVATGGSPKVVYSFAGGFDGSHPYAGLIAVNGTLYGTTAVGGAYGNGTVFSVTPAGVETVLYSFAGGTDGAQPFGSKLLHFRGALYGTTSEGGAYNKGTIFKVALTGEEEVLHSFGKGHDGFYPEAGLIEVGGVLYGTTGRGGKYDSKGQYFGGTVFAYKP